MVDKVVLEVRRGRELEQLGRCLITWNVNSKQECEPNLKVNS